MYYEGYFYEGFALAKDGIAVWPEGSYYRGNILNSRLEGDGVYYNAYSTLNYRGQWKNDKPQGLGTERWANGNNFEGQFKDGYKDGKGKFAWQNGATYDGDFKIGYMWGRGTLRKGNGIYEG